MTPNEILGQSLEENITKIVAQVDIAKTADADTATIQLYDNVLNHFCILNELVSTTTLSQNYLNQFQSEIDITLKFFPYRNNNDSSFINENQKFSIKTSIESQLSGLTNHLKLMQFNFDFFTKLNFFQNNVVAVGANGSGKTTLSNELKKYLPQNGVVIAAQKILIIPTFSGISNQTSTSQQLLQTQSADKTLRTTYSTENSGNAYHILANIGTELKILLDNLLAERSAIRNQFCDAINNGSTDRNVPETKLDKTLYIWNSLIQHRTMECSDGINITLKTEGIDPYQAHQMSDGEKVTLYLIAQILQAPQDGFIIVDEPEMYLHKTILTKLWDKLEKERQDCIFIYLTHDLDFAASRPTAKKVWIRSFTHPNHWEIENIPQNELPESLLMELLGSRKTILFCEGVNGSIDEKVYNILFQEFTITPVESCFDVMSYTKAFNKIPNTTVKAYGLIDSDHHHENRLQKLKLENVFSFSMSEVESLFFDENFLKALAIQLLKDEDTIQLIKIDVLALLEKEKELQISNYVSAKINYYFKDSHVSKGNSLREINTNFAMFADEVKIQDWYDIRTSEINEILRSKNYPKALQIFNNKGLRAVANKHLKITDFTERSLQLLQFNPVAITILQTYFPTELMN